MKKLYYLIATLTIAAMFFVGCSTEQTSVNSDFNVNMAPIILPAGATVTSATLNIYVVQPNEETINVHRITSDWDENTVTWNSFGGAFSPLIENSFSGSFGWQSTNITALFNEWADGTYNNFGLLLDQAEMNFPWAIYYSREFSTNHPYLEVCYMLNGVETCVQVEAIADTYIWEKEPDWNKGTSFYLYTGWKDATFLEKQTLLRFETPDIPDIPENCMECKGGMVELTLGYNGPSGHVIVYNDKNDKADKIIFEGNVTTGESFTFIGSGKDNKMSAEISVFVDGVRNTNIHVSCSRPIGVGFVFGDFEVLSGISKDNGILCPLTQDDPSDCMECKGGMVELTLGYNGPSGHVIVYNDKNDKADKIIFEGDVLSGESFTFIGSGKDNKMRAEISVFVDGVRNTNIHVSCSRPIGVGFVFGDFEVLGGISKDGGELCPLSQEEPQDPEDPSGCSNCKGGMVELTLGYNGPSGHIIVYNDKNDKADKIIFEGDVLSGESFTFIGSGKDNKMKAEISIFVDGVRNTNIHVSCSRPIGVGFVFGDFEILGGISKDGGELCIK